MEILYYAVPILTLIFLASGFIELAAAKKFFKRNKKAENVPMKYHYLIITNNDNTVLFNSTDDLFFEGFNNPDNARSFARGIINQRQLGDVRTVIFPEKYPPIDILTNSPLTYEEWYDIHEDELIMEFAESGLSREMDFNLELELERKYIAYLKSVEKN